MYVYREEDMEDLYNEPDLRNDIDDDDDDPFERWSQYVISDDWDFVVDRRRMLGELKTTTCLKSKRHENMSFFLRPKQFAKLLYYREQIDNEVKALDNKSRPVNFHVYIGNSYFVSVQDGWDYVDIFHYTPPRSKCSTNCTCVICILLLYVYHEGISISFDKWRQLLELIPTIHEEYPELAKEQLTHKWGA